jgi:hypothetical protein
MKLDDTAVGCSKELVPKVVWTMEGPLWCLKGITLKGIRTATP